MSTPFPDPIIKPFSNTGDNAAPPLGPIATAANQETGFPILEATPLDAGGIEVTREEFNGAINFYTKQILALVSGARFTFNAALSAEQNGYPMGAVLYCASDNSLQRSLVDNNTANFITTPSFINDGVNWSAVVIDNIFCENLVVNDGGVVSFLNSDSTHAVTFKAPTVLEADTAYHWPNYLPPTLGTPFNVPQALVGDSFGQLYWAFVRESRLTYIQTALITVTAGSNLTFNTFYDGANIFTSPIYYDIATGVFTSPGAHTYKIELNIELGTVASPIGVSVIDLATNQIIGNLFTVTTTEPVPTKCGSVYVKLTNGQQIALRGGTVTYGAPLPFVSTQLSISWYQGLS